MTIQETLALALQHHQAGRLHQAEQLYGQILQAAPQHADALHLLGVLANQQGRHEQAIAWIEQAVRLDGRQARFHKNLGGVYGSRGRMAEAIGCYQRAVWLAPDFVEAHYCLADALLAEGRLEEAAACYRQALRLNPDLVGAHVNLGYVLEQLGRCEEAVACNRQALRLQPDLAMAHNNLGNALAGLDQLAAAEACFREAVRLDPDRGETYTNLARVLREQGQLEEAVRCSQQALRLAPDYALAHNNLGNALQEQGRMEEAEAAYRQAVWLKPDFALAHNNLGAALCEQGRLEEALASYDRAVRLDPDSADAHKNRALAWLLTGDFAQGWREYEWRWKQKRMTAPAFTQPRWDGAPLQGRTILLYAEQGLGDTLQFVRYAPLVRQRGGRVLVLCPEALVRLLASCPGVDQVVAEGAALPGFDVQAPLLSVPGLLGTTLENIPAAIPYLQADPALVLRWRTELQALPGFKIGVGWQGNPAYKGDRWRSFPVSCFEALTRIEGVQLISLQKGPGAEQLRSLAGRMAILDLGDRLDAAGAFTDTAALMRNVDLVITSDTALAHLAGALGVPAWVALPFAPDWRWLLERQDSPWYPSLRLFRQHRPDDWSGVFARIAAALRERPASDRRGAVAEAADAPIADALTLALKHHQAGQGRQAEQLYRRVLQQDPRNVDALHLLGLLAHQSGRNDLAVESVRQALFLKPDFAEAHCNLGVVLEKQGRLDEAEACQRQALRLKPDFAEALSNLGAVLEQQGKLEEAEASQRQALRLKPDVAETLVNLGNVLKRQGKTEEAIGCYREALRHDAGSAATHNNLGILLQEQERLDEAMRCSQQALRLQPDFAEAHSNLGVVLRKQGRLAEALASYDRAVRLDPDSADAHKNRALAWLLTGDFAQGWREYEWRWKQKRMTPPAFTQPRWDGAPLQGRTILLYAEQGLGDTLQFVRYAPLVRQRGGRVLVLCPEALVRLLASCPGVDQVVAEGAALPGFDVQAPLLSVPGLLGTTLENIPAAIPYLQADPALVLRWRTELQALPGFKIGVGWQGNPAYKGDRWRSFPVSCFEALTRIEGVQLISLQKGPGAEQLRSLAGRMAILDLGDRLDAAGAFTDTAALMRNVDLVITSDTALAHLAGALGVPAWLALPFAPDWRWLLERQDSPWYPSLRLFRQHRPDDWPGVFARIAAALRERPASDRRGAVAEAADAPIADALTLALKHHQAGQGRQAEQLYRRVLQQDPRNVDALHLLGLLAHQSGRNDLAVESIRQALFLKPDLAEAHSNLGAVLEHQGKLKEAEASQRQALRLNPDLAQAHSNLSAVLEKQGKLAEAEASLRQVLGLNPDVAEAHSNLGVVLEQQGKLAEAEASQRQALRLQPDLAQAHCNLGVVLEQQGKLAEAEASQRQALRLQPDLAQAHCNLGMVLEKLGRLEEAEASLRQALRLKPDLAQAQSNLGVALEKQGKLAEAEASLRQALSLKPDYAEAHCNLSAVLEQQGKLAEAEASLQQALRLKPDYAEAHCNLGMVCLLTGNFAQGWREYEWRWKRKGATPPAFTQPRWDGAPLQGRTILLHAEQGLGDTLQFIRYAPLVQQRGGRVLVSCPESLVHFLTSCPGVDQVVAEGAALPGFDVQAPLLSVPGLLGTTLENIPAAIPYLQADPALVLHWRTELQALPGCKIGVGWQGNPAYKGDRWRSFPVSCFETLTRIEGVQLISLQKGPGAEQLRSLAGRMAILDLGDRLDAAGAFTDTAALMRNVDLVITSDTALAHLAGALGVPAWVALPFAPDWRWLLDREDSPWYPGMRLFRQHRPDDWPGVFARIAAALRERPAADRRGAVAEAADAPIADALALALKHHQAGQGRQAEQLYRRILQQDPRNVDALHLLGLLAHQSGRNDLAVESIRQALFLKPDFAAAHCNLGVVLEKQGRLEEAEASQQQALRLKPDFAEALSNLGAVLEQQGKLEEAEASLRQALRLKPDVAEALVNLGNVLKRQGKTEEAIGCYREALRHDAGSAATHNNLGILLQEQERLDEAARCSQQALRLQPDFAAAHSNLGVVLRKQGKLEEAEASQRQALRLQPDLAQAHSNLGVVLEKQGKLAEALASYDRAVRLDPDSADAHKNRALAWLLTGDFAQGWREYEWRWKQKRMTPPAFTQPRWDGSPLQGRTILLHAEQGLGDTLQFIRYAPLVQQHGGRVLVSCPESLVHLLASCPGVDQVVAEGAALPGFDVQAPLLSVPGLLGTTLENIPAAIPYLQADPALVLHWRTELQALPGFKIGVGWQGNPAYKGDRWRSFPVSCFEALTRIEGVQLISLQKGPGVEQLRSLAGRMAILDLGDRLDAAGAFTDTAALMRNVDLVITSDTALAHLAGALGVPAWVALPFAPDWRWLLDREDSPWYPGMRLFRQHRPDDWPGVFARIAAALRERPVSDRRGAVSEGASTPIADALALALKHHQAGQGRQAEQLYRQVLQQDPRNVDALHLLGLLAHQSGRNDLAVESIRQALRLKPHFAQAHSNLGAVLEQQDKLEEAEASQRQALRLQPDLAQAHRNLSAVLEKQGKLEEAEASLRQALRLQPDVAETLVNLGNVLKRQGKTEEAIGCYREALRHDAGSAATHNNLGILLREQGWLDEAVQCCWQALRLQPDFAPGHRNLGAVLEKQGKLAEAEASLRQALRLKPDFPEAHSNLSAVLGKQGRLAEAEASLRQALRLKPDLAEAHSNLSAVLEQQGKLEEAEASLRQALRLKPDLAEAHSNLGAVLEQQRRLEEAEACQRQALQLKPDLAQAHSNLGVVLEQQGRLEEAEACQRQALQLKPDLAQAHNTLGLVLEKQGKVAEALASYDRAVQLDPDSKDGHLNRALAWLLTGNFAQGWREYEWRWKRKGATPPAFRQPRWDGAPLQGRTILLYAEQGLGDTLQFIRYAPLVRQRGGRVLVLCPEALVRLLASCPGVDQVVAEGAALPGFDVQAPLLSVPGLLGTTLENIPAAIPYLQADPALVLHWRTELQVVPGFKIGVGWQGNPAYKGDRWRSFPVSCFEALTRIEGVQLISLQKGPGAEQLRSLAGRMAILDLGDRLDAAGAFTDTAALMRNVDLVITSDTALAHLAGALGVPAWLALPFAPDWRWLLDREDSPWYPSLRLFRQRRPGDWQEVFDRIAAAMHEGFPPA